MFLIRCTNCGKEVQLVSGYVYTGYVGGSLIRLELEVDEDEPERSQAIIACDGCGNTVYIET